jgi:hypothetical protein
MLPWREFAGQVPAMAERGRERLGIGIAYLATVRRDGSPRLHPVSPIFTADGRLMVAIGHRSPKRFDLANDGRYALHALPPPLEAEDYDEFEFNLTGTARRLPFEDAASWAAARDAAGHVIRDDDWLFEFLVEGALTTRWFGLGVPGQSPTNEQQVWRLGWDAPRDRATLPREG